ncbi:glycosyltransferase [Octadecabacter sp.]|nr:glycosyltransferase [Octadecabacter sp.]
MKISVITVCYNSENTILDTLTSIIEQTYNNVEIVIVDGGSIDNTLKIIEQAEIDNLRLISERDFGIYDAMNKGLRLATGDIIHFLNSDDVYADFNILENVVSIFEKRDADVCYGGIRYIDSDMKAVGTWDSKPFTSGQYKNGWHTPHPGFFAKKYLFLNLGTFDPDMKIAADFDLMKRFMEHDGTRSVQVNKILVNMRDDGASSGLKAILKGFLEIRQSFRKDGHNISLTFLINRYAKKVLRKAKIQDWIQK